MTDRFATEAVLPAAHAGSARETARQVDTRRSWRRDSLWLALLFGLLFGFVLGSRPLANPDEARYAEIPREMLANGDWVTPQLDGIPYFEKPPLVYWLGALAQKFFGESEWSVRLVPAIFALGGVMLTYAAARRLHGRGTGLGAAIVLGTSMLYFALARILILDMAVSVLMAAALFCFILGIREPAGWPRRLLFCALYASAALATLTKGLMGFLVPGAVMFLWLLLFRQWKRLRPLYLPTGAALFLAIALPWHVLVALRNPDWVQAYLVHEHWERFTVDLGHYEPWWYFIPILFAGLFPWTGFLWPGFRVMLPGGWARRREHADGWFFAAWAGFMFLFYSKSASKLIPYILPVVPALAVVIGMAVARQWAGRETARWRGGFGVFALCAALLGIATIVAVSKPGLIRDAAQAAVLRPYGWTMGAWLLSGAVTTALAMGRTTRIGFAIVAATMIGFYAVLILAVGEMQRPGTKSLALLAKTKLSAGDRVYHYHAFLHDFVYYSGQTVGLVDHTDELGARFLTPAERAARFIDSDELRRQWAGPGRVWLVARKRDTQALLADPGFPHEEIAETRTFYLLSNRR